MPYKSDSQVRTSKRLRSQPRIFEGDCQFYLFIVSMYKAVPTQNINILKKGEKRNFIQQGETSTTVRTNKAQQLIPQAKILRKFKGLQGWGSLKLLRRGFIPTGRW